MAPNSNNKVDQANEMFLPWKENHFVIHSILLFRPFIVCSSRLLSISFSIPELPSLRTLIIWSNNWSNVPLPLFIRITHIGIHMYFIWLTHLYQYRESIPWRLKFIKISHNTVIYLQSIDLNWSKSAYQGRYQRRYQGRMGNFVGHIVPGLIFLLHGMLMHNDSMHDYFQKVSSGGYYESKIFYTARQCWITLIGVTITMIGELVTGFNWSHFVGNHHSNHSHDHAGNMSMSSSIPMVSDPMIGMKDQNATGDESNMLFRHETYHHVSIYMSAVPVALISLLDYKNKLSFLPKGLDHLLFSFGSMNAAFMFLFHSFGTSRLESTLHALVFLSFFMVTASAFVHLVLKQSILVTLARCWSMILVGTWFIQTAFILYSPIKNFPIIGVWSMEHAHLGHDHAGHPHSQSGHSGHHHSGHGHGGHNPQLMMIPVTYSFHMFLAFAYIFFRTILIATKVRKQSCPSMSNEQKYNYIQYKSVGE